MKNAVTIVLVSAVAAAAGFTLSYKYGRAAPEPIEQVADVHAMNVAANTNPTVTTLPDVSLENRAGQKQSLRSWPGKSMIVNFWATWCGPCRKEIPLLQEIAKTKSKDDFQLVGIAVDFRDAVIKYADEMKIEYPLLMGEQDGIAAAEAFGVNNLGLPFTAFTDNKGRIVTLYMGELTKPKIEAILSSVQRVNKGELTPEAARAAIQSKMQAMKVKA